MQSLKKINLEMLRIIACFLVIVNHTNSNIFISRQPSKTWFVSLAYFFVCKIAVPVFVMISGAVLLNKNESYKDVFKKRISKIILVIIIFSLVYYLNGVILGAYPFDLVDFFSKIYTSPITLAYWYLYTYLGLMVMLPLLRKTVKEFNTNDYYYCITIWLIFYSIMPVLSRYFSFSNINENFSLPLVGGLVVYFITGHFIQNKLDSKYFSKKYAIIAWVLFFIFIGLAILLTYKEYQINKDSYLFLDSRIYITIAIPSISAFYLGKYYFSSMNKTLEKIAIIIGECTLGIFLISDLLIQKLYFIYTWGVRYLHPLISVIILEVSVFTVGFIIAFLLRKVPLLKRII